MTSPEEGFVIRHLFDTVAPAELPVDLLVQSQRIGPGDVWRIEDLGVSAVVDLTYMEVLDDDRAEAVAALAERGISHVHVPVTGPDDIAGACDALLQEVRYAAAAQRAVVVHCHGGVDRSVCVAMAVKAHREDTAFAVELHMATELWDDIAVTDTMARPAEAWVKAKGGPDPVDQPDPMLLCPRCSDHIIGGLCERDTCDHTACPYCGDGRGSTVDGCPHLVLECHEVFGPGAEGNPDVLEARLTRVPDTVPMPYLAAPPASDRAAFEAIGPWLTAPENPWPRGLDHPPDRAALMVVASAIAGACLRCNAAVDFGDNLESVPVSTVRAYALKPGRYDARVRTLIMALAKAMEPLGQVKMDRP